MWVSNNSEEQLQKRRRQTEKLERLMELVDNSGRFCFRWFAVMAQMLSDFSSLLAAEDYLPLVKMLSDYQATIQYPIQIDSFIRITKTMLSNESALKENSAIISGFSHRITEYWHKIMKFSFKQAATNKMQSNNLNLVRTLIENKVFVSHEFIKSIINDMVKTSSVKKSNDSIGLLISIMRNVNVNLVEGIVELKIEIINWMSCNVKASELKKVIQNDSELDKTLIAELYVLCIISKPTEKIIIHTPKAQQYPENKDDYEFEKLLRDLEMCLNYQTLIKLVAIENQEETKSKQFKNIDVLPNTDEIDVIINDRTNDALETSLNSDDNVGSFQNPLDEINAISTSLITYVGILNQLVLHKVFDVDGFEKSNIKKRILVQMGRFNDIFGHSNTNKITDMNDVNEIVNNLLQIWNDSLHPIVTLLVFKPTHTNLVIKWLTKRLSNESHKPTSVCLEPLRSAAKLSVNERVQLKCLKLLAYFSEYENGNETHAFNAIDNIRFNYKRNEDLYIVFEIVQVKFVFVKISFFFV